ncbi:MAG: hypothetical protein FD166_1336 [Bacteroidetes bacterium]|nr:MAG: hypothetical protein FD166_1336 [Bacteroidota bacterium]
MHPTSAKLTAYFIRDERRGTWDDKGEGATERLSEKRR